MMVKNHKNIIFITHFPLNHIGGVETHVKNLIRVLQIKKYKVTIISKGNINPPDIKYAGLIYIWYWFLKNSRKILESDIIHIHDVFIWYLPLRIFFPRKKVFVTFHGWEGKWPFPMWTIWNKKIANYLCSGSISVGRYIEKYYGIKSNFIIYGGVSHKSLITDNKTPNSLVWLGRQDSDTGINEFKKWLKNHPELKSKFVTNVKNPEKYLKTAEYCVPSGYLSYFEAKNMGCKIMTFANNLLKEDYWNEIKLLKTIPTWDEVANIYLKLWRC